MTILKFKVDLLKNDKVINEVSKAEIFQDRMKLFLFGERVAYFNRNAEKVVREQLARLLNDINDEFKYIVEGSRLYKLSLKVYNKEEKLKNEIMLADDFDKLGEIIRILYREK